MSEFNILSPEEKKHLITLQNVKIASVWGLTLFIFFVFSTLLLLPAYFFLTFQKNEVVRNLEITEGGSLTKRIDEIAQSVATLKKDALDIKKISENSEVLSAMVRATLEPLPRGITLIAARYSPKSGDISFYGTAGTRSALLQFEALLKNNPKIQNVNVPLANLVSETDVPFSISASFKKP
jgi:hypothetical protein